MAQSTLTLDDGLHVTVKMIAAARRQPVSAVITDFLQIGLTETLREDPELGQLVRVLVERDTGVSAEMRRSVLCLLDTLEARGGER